MRSHFNLFIYFIPTKYFSHNYKPDEGYVATAEIAVKIAEAVLKPIYGDKEIDQEKPLVATLTKDNVWIVTGTMRPDRKGGVAEIRIDKDKGTILGVTHGQ